MDKYICSECGTENEKEYKYCKNCGAPIQETHNPQEKQETSDSGKQEYKENCYNNNFQYNNNKQYQYSANSNYAAPNYIDGIPKEELAMYIGRKAYEIMPKFNKMELSQSKISWCWPAAIFGFLFGPMGAALWFFYRKMFKPAIILSVIATVLSIITALLTFDSTSEALNSILSAFGTGDIEQIFENLENFEPETTIFTVIADLINEITNTATGILCGLFGYYIYKKHCVEKILAYRTVRLNPSYYHIGLPAIGGVSGGMLALGIVIMLGISYLANFITIIAAML